MAIELASAPAPRFDRAVVFACDANYLKPALFAAVQVARLHPGRDFDICVCTMGEAPAPVPGLAEHCLRFCRIATGAAFDGLFLDARRTESVYLRLALPRAFAREYRRMLYLDSDVFVQRSGFGALLGVDLRGHALAAVRDHLQWRWPKRQSETFRKVGLASAPYFNSGALLIDVASFNARGILERCVAFGRSSSGHLDGHDQHLLNCVLHGDWAELSPVWNWQHTRTTRFFEAVADAHVVHFIGQTKPWNDAHGYLPPRFGRAYRDFCAAYFPDAPPPGSDGPAPHRKPALLRASFLKHLLSTGQLCAYLDRFETELSVISARGAGSARDA